MPPPTPQPDLHPHARALAYLVRLNPNLTAAWIDHHGLSNRINVTQHAYRAPETLCVPAPLLNFKIIYYPNVTFHTLEAPLGPIDTDNPHQACQDEPVRLGTQIQPAAATWLGTAGAPVRWNDPSDITHWGILSNWHVMTVTHTPLATPQHQPTTDYAPIAHLFADSPVDPHKINTIDAAIAHALIDGKHTISDSILEIGPLTRAPIDATPGQPAQKSGRTTRLTRAICTAVGAAVKVGYPNFTATFQDQDIYTDTDPPFSAPGDSGSLITSEPNPAPLSLLFAGGANLTVGNPMRHVAHHFNIQHPFS